VTSLPKPTRWRHRASTGRRARESLAAVRDPDHLCVETTARARAAGGGRGGTVVGCLAARGRIRSCGGHEGRGARGGV